MIKCSTSGVLSVYAKNSGCTGNLVEKFSLSASAATLTSTTGLGKITGQYSLFQQGQVVYNWVALTPSSFLVPRFEEAPDFLGTAMFAIACLGALCVVIYFARKYRTKPTRYMLYFLISQIIWLLWVIAKTVYYYTIFADVNSFALYSEVMSFVFNLATLSTVLNSAMFLLKFTNRKSVIWKFIIYSSLILLNLVFSGALYVDYFRFVGSYQSTVKQWNQLSIIWITIMFLYNMLPSIVVTVELLKATDMSHGYGEERSLFSRFIALHRSSKLFTYLALGQIFTIIGFAIMDVLKLNTSAFGGDRMFQAADGFLAFFLVTHAILNCLFIENVGLIAELRSRMKSSSGSRSQSKSVSLVIHGNTNPSNHSTVVNSPRYA
ncbi:hypothetical protein HDU91_004796 [Kappamyces sp. JEL0680]|nr:hypothetical protein HDU91_004796 [Kappamyces sp. JEL0680]